MISLLFTDNHNHSNQGLTKEELWIICEVGAKVFVFLEIGCAAILASQIVYLEPMSSLPEEAVFHDAMKYRVHKRNLFKLKTKNDRYLFLSNG